MISGAAGSTEATEHAIRGLAEFLMIVLQDDANAFDLNVSSALHGVNSHDFGSSQSYLEQLRHLNCKTQNPSHISGDTSGTHAVQKQGLSDKQRLNAGGSVGPLHVKRTPEWIERVTNNVDKLLNNAFPHLCTHPSKRVRRGLLSSVQGLLLNCSHVLKGSRLMLLECLCILVCDDSEEVSLAAQDFLGFLFSTPGKDTVQDDAAELFNRLLDKLPKAVLGSEESVALASAQQMLAVIYYSGPQLVLDHLLCSPIKAAKLFDVFALCLSQESVFAGSLGKVVSSTPTTGYLHSLAELRAGGKNSIHEHTVIMSEMSEVSSVNVLAKETQHSSGHTFQDYELPRMPPWFVHVGSYKLYQALAGLLRLVGSSLLADCRSEVALLEIVDIPLGFLRKLVSDFRLKDCNKESWDSWYTRSQSGQLLRQASTAACILNEMMFGMSDQTTNILKDIFHVSVAKADDKQKNGGSAFSHTSANSHWEAAQSQRVRQHVIDCVGIILHEYTTPEVWDVPHTPLLQSGEKTNLHFFRDVAMLHQVLIDGIGIFNLCLGKDFVSSGFLCSSLYLLLENLICSYSEVRHAADAVLHVISATSGYPTVGHLVVANADYVIDSLCHQLRHLDLNPQVPNVLAAMLSYVGVAHKILPLLEEPMRCVSMELEILGRHHHPELTMPFLKAVAEIAKAAKQEADGLPAQSESYAVVVNCKVSDLMTVLERDNIISGESETDAELCGSVSMEEWESILFKLNDNKRYRRIVASIAASCLTAVIPLVASTKEPICLVALDIIEHVIMTLAKVEEAYAHEKETKEAIVKVASLCSFYHLTDILEATDEGADENRLLPAMNKIWPFLVACIRNKLSVPIRRCVEMISNTVKICGGNFFTRRFHNDGPNFWKLLTTSPFTRKSIRNKEAAPLLLPYRNTSRTLEDPVSETSNLKTQEAILRMIANLSQDKRSSSALDVALKKVCGLVVGVACSGVTGLRDASIAALSGLATIDPDLVWLLMADVYYSFKGEDIRPPPLFPELAEVLPTPLSSKDYLFVQYGGQTYGFDINFSSVEIVFKKLYPEMYQ
ncbi:hypothetical protein RND81_10G187600 [Saponaria officinalis]